MYKKIIMQADFDAVPMTGIPISEYLDHETGYVDVGGFEMKAPGFEETIPFDFESTVFETVDQDSYSFGNWDGLGTRVFDVDPCHEEEWRKNGLERKDITAELLASAESVTEFYFELSDMRDRAIPVFLTVNRMLFTDEENRDFEIKPDVLKAYNQFRVAEQVSDLLNEFRDQPIYGKKQMEEIEAITRQLQKEDPKDVLSLIHLLQKNGMKNQHCRMLVDFCIDEIMQVARAKDNIYRVSLMAHGNIDHGKNPYEMLEGTHAGYYYADSIKECQRAVRAYIEKYDLGAGEWTGGLAFKGNEYFGGISYNGRFWDKENKSFHLARLNQTDLLDLNGKLQCYMPMFQRNFQKQLDNTLSKRNLDKQITEVSGNQFSLEKEKQPEQQHRGDNLCK